MERPRTHRLLFAYLVKADAEPRKLAQLLAAYVA